MKLLLENIIDNLKNGKSMEMVTIVDSIGSTPRGAGAVMVCLENGKSMGTIGGGNIEFKSQKIAAKALKEKKSFFYVFMLRTNKIEDLGMVCGGNNTVLFWYIDACDPNTIKLWKDVKSTYDYGEKGWLIAGISKGNGISLSLCHNANEICAVFPSLTGGDIRTFIKKRSAYLEKDDEKFYSVLVSQPALVYIFGAGHISQCLAKLLDVIDFRTVIYDDRKKYADRKLFPTAAQIIVDDFINIGKHISVSNRDYVVIMTDGHKKDCSVLAQVLRFKPLYTGMIGSNSKIRANYKKLREIYSYTDDELNSVYAPIGLPIGSETPEEIAVSIAAQLIKVRADDNQNLTEKFYKL